MLSYHVNRYLSSNFVRKIMSPFINIAQCKKNENQKRVVIMNKKMYQVIQELEHVTYDTEIKIHECYYLDIK